MDAPLMPDGEIVTSYGRRSANQHPDAATIDGIKSGDVTALADAYRDHGGRVYAVTRALCGEAHAEEATQRVFLGLWTAPSRYDAERGPLLSYLLTQAHSQAVEILRDHNHGRSCESTDEHDQVHCSPTDGATNALGQGHDLDHVLTSLPEGERQAIVLACFGGHTYREIARLLTVPDAVVKDAIRRGLHRLGGTIDEAHPID